MTIQKALLTMLLFSTQVVAVAPSTSVADATEAQSALAFARLAVQGYKQPKPSPTLARCTQLVNHESNFAKDNSLRVWHAALTCEDFINVGKVSLMDFHKGDTQFTIRLTLTSFPKLDSRRELDDEFAEYE